MLESRANNQASPVFLANPDSYGRLGHQTNCMLVPLCLAYLNNGFFLPTKYNYFASYANSCIDFSRSSYAKNYLPNSTQYHEIDGLIPDQYGNNKYDLNRIEDFLRLHAEINAIKSMSQANYALIRLPFDQMPGRLMSAISKIPISDIKNIFHFSPLENIVRLPCQDYIAVHIRRGDVNASSHPEWFIDDHVYFHLLEYLLSLIPSNISVVVLTQGELEIFSTSVLRKSIQNGSLIPIIGEKAWKTSNDLASFKVLMSAKLIIGNLSSFSFLPSLLMRVPFVSLANPGVKPSSWPASRYHLLETQDILGKTNKLDFILNQIHSIDI